MTISHLATLLPLSAENPAAKEASDREFSGVYAGDLLSRAMSHVKSGDLFITIMANRNTVAVASLCDACAVLLAEGVTLPEDAKEAADENGIPVFSSPLSVYDLCRIIGGAGDKP